LEEESESPKGREEEAGPERTDRGRFKLPEGEKRWAHQAFSRKFCGLAAGKGLVDA